MTKLVLLIVAAAWAAVLIPPMLRSRIENRPNSSVTDFRRQLSTLQSTSTPARGSLRGMGRPLAQSPLPRPAAGGRPGQPMHRQVSIHEAPASRGQQHNVSTTQRYRSHGDPSSGYERPHRQTHMANAHVARAHDPRAAVRRRRSNVLFVLVVTTACSMFLAATTGSSALLYVFAAAFLALCGYVYLLAQLRQREQSGWHDGWLERR
jgi:hypothetical protein